jgi:hypothetical protein
MNVCIPCRKEMKCQKTGMAVRYHENGEHCYAGDIFRCPSCGAEIAVTNPNSYYDPEAKTETDSDVWMEQIKSINLNLQRTNRSSDLDGADKGYKPKPPTDEQVERLVWAHDLCYCQGLPHNMHRGCG